MFKKKIEIHTMQLEIFINDSVCKQIDKYYRKQEF